MAYFRCGCEKDGVTVTIDGVEVENDLDLLSYIENYNNSVSTLPYELKYGCSIVYNDEIHILGGYVEGSGTNHYMINKLVYIKEG